MSQDLSNARLDRAQLASVADAIKSGQSLEIAADQIGLDSQEALLNGLARSLRLQIVDLSEIEIDESILEEFPVRLVHRHEFFPLYRRGGALVVAVTNPFDFQAIDTLSASTGEMVQPVICDPAQVRDLIKRYLGVGAETIDGLLALQRDDDEFSDLESLTGQDLEDAEVAQQASVVRLVNEILEEAIEARASDIHIEAQEKRIKIRYRIDGVLQKQSTPPEMHQFSSCDHQSTEDHGQIEYCRKTRSSGRSDQASDQRKRLIFACRSSPCCTGKVSLCVSSIKPTSAFP